MSRPARSRTPRLRPHATGPGPAGRAHPRKSEAIREDVLRIVRERGGRCLHLDFRNCNSAMLLECEKGHVWRTRVEQIARGSWCHVCGRGRIAAAIRKHFGVLDLDDADEIGLYAESQGLVFVAGDPPRRGRTDFFRCDEGHLWEVSRQEPTGPWCPACGGRGTAMGVGRTVR